MRYSVLSLNLIAQRYEKKKDSFLSRHGDGPHNQVNHREQGTWRVMLSTG